MIMWRAFSLALCAVCFLSVPGNAAAQESILHPLFSDHAVLQRDRPIAVWGHAGPRERITVEFAGATARTRADARGNWRATLPSRPAGGPYVLSARSSGGASQTASDILVGDVYLCSGQSNMEFQTRYATNAAAVLGASETDRIRLLTVPRVITIQPQSSFASEAQWQRANGETVGDFSAVCYFFAREIEAAAQAPIGLINSSWGGTRIEAWMNPRALRRAGGLDAELAALDEAAADPDNATARYGDVLRAWWSTRDPGARAGWGADAFDDAAWPNVSLGGFWEAGGVPALAQFDGVAWFRSDFELTAEQAAQSATLTLGPIDDIDITSINGRVVGSQGGWDTPRSYAIAPGVLRAGSNSIAVGVLDTGGGGGLWGRPETRALTFADGSTVQLDRQWRYQISANLWDTEPPPNAPWGGPNGLTALYNGMIAPLSGFGLRGVLWYQGEANVGNADAYERLLPSMMEEWRTTFAAPRLPFYVVQLANFGEPYAAPQRYSWGGLRDAQRRVAAADANSGLAVTIDIGDRFDIHPTQKLIVARRLALLARHRIYGDEVGDSGPTPTTARREGGAIVVAFDHGPLVAYSAARPIAFELCDATRACRFVDADMEGEHVRLNGAQAADAYVRYCWGDAPLCNLYNREDLPATPFEIEVRSRQ
jgi:sialate O-acetylesterase